ncbi:long-chain fatty acid--CoA ligase [Oscillochloris sp. ZM17-4]|uniref:long-chain-fatty-acid--CoA ligase n=1 Tax=Oscillochloris sp. ZM17-4 TaxID=2866714 RepID=UPI001C734FA6|nr:long-chain fatty acid--CoA ligase [Oscillochloris sp. ZM17-4]MBX0328163.1 long-chain fatty acid--CoA ligase [Oscillochloris sp. ZM17-4]
MASVDHYDPGVPHRIEIAPAPIPALLDAAAERFPAAPAISFYGRTVSYRELREAARRFAGGLLRAGLAPGERVVLMLPNVPQAVICYYGALLAGGIVVLSNPLTDAAKLTHELADSGAGTLVALSMFSDLVEQARAAGAAARVIYTNLKEYLPATQRGLFTMLRQGREGHRVPDAIARQALWLQHMLADAPGDLPQLHATDDAVILYTSGTTGQSKGVLHTHASLHANALQTSAWFAGAAPGAERVLCAVPFSHSYGMTACMNMSVALAAAMVLLPTFETQHVLKAIQRERPTIFPGVPPMYAAINEVRGVRKYGLSSLKGCLSGAAPLPVEVQEGFERITRARLVEGYGLTEAGPATHANPIFGDRRSGTIGLPLPNTEARIVDLHSGADLPAGEVGELLVRGPQLMKGYWGRPEETAEALTADGWLRTGDVARMTPDGYFQVIERKKEMIIAGAYNIYPRDVEEVLYEHPKVIDAAVVGVPGPDGQPAIKAFVVLRAGEQISEEEVFAFLRERLHLPVMPSSVEFRAALPRTFIGKIMRRLLVEPPE